MVIDLKNCTIKLKDGYGGPGGSPIVNNQVANPVTVPTVNVTGGGASGGLLGAGTYLVSYTWINATGETLRSPDSTPFVVASGNIPQVTIPSLPSLATGANIYLSTAGGNTASETRYNGNTPVVTTTYNLSIAAPSGAAPPVSNTTGGYNAGTTTIVVSGFTGAVVNGDLFTVAGDTPRHTVTAHTETLSNTTSITFTPATGSFVAQAAVITALPHELKIKIGDGNLTYDEKRKIKYVLDRGILDSVKLEDQEPMDVKLDFMWEFLRASQVSDPPTFEEALKQIGNASSWVSSAADKCQPYSVDIEITDAPPCAGVKTEVILLPDFRWESLNHDPKNTQVAATGKCNAMTAVVSRV